MCQFSKENSKKSLVHMYQTKERKTDLGANCTFPINKMAARTRTTSMKGMPSTARLTLHSENLWESATSSWRVSPKKITFKKITFCQNQSWFTARIWSDLNHECSQNFTTCLFWSKKRSFDYLPSLNILKIHKSGLHKHMVQRVLGIYLSTVPIAEILSS